MSVDGSERPRVGDHTGGDDAVGHCVFPVLLHDLDFLAPSLLFIRKTRDQFLGTFEFHDTVLDVVLELFLVGDLGVEGVFELLETVVDFIEFVFLDLEDGGLFLDDGFDSAELVSERLCLGEHLVEGVDGVDPEEDETDGEGAIAGSLLGEIRRRHDFLLEHGDQSRVDRLLLVTLQVGQEHFGLIQKIGLRSHEVVVLLLSERVVGVSLLNDLSLLLFLDVVQVQDDQTTHDHTTGGRRVVQRLDFGDMSISQQVNFLDNLG